MDTGIAPAFPSLAPSLTLSGRYGLPLQATASDRSPPSGFAPWRRAHAWGDVSSDQGGGQQRAHLFGGPHVHALAAAAAAHDRLRRPVNRAFTAQ